jgi:hypothetical protein
MEAFGMGKLNKKTL